MVVFGLLQDSTQIQSIDAVIYCTGYQYAYPFLEGTGLITSHDMRVDPLWQHIFPPSVGPTLAFVGLAWKSVRNQQFELQVCCTYLTPLFTGQASTACTAQNSSSSCSYFLWLALCLSSSHAPLCFHRRLPSSPSSSSAFATASAPPYMPLCMCRPGWWPGRFQVGSPCQVRIRCSKT